MSVKVGDVFGKWTVIEDLGLQPVGKTGRKERKFRCRCQCSKVRDIVSYGLSRSKSRDSGHLMGCSSCHIKRISTTHGLSDSPEYRVWTDINTRITNSNNSRHDCYGGRGLGIDPDFVGKGGFESWLAEVGPRPSSKHSIDRVDNSQGYIKGNMRWTDAKTQCRNRRSNRQIAIDGIEMLLCEWSEISGVHVNTIWNRLDRGISPKKAVFCKPNCEFIPEDADMVLLSVKETL